MMRQTAPEGRQAKSTDRIASERLEEILRRVLEYAEGERYAGYNKFDALNSPFLKRLSFDRKWLRFALTQAVMRSPWNLRPLLGVEKTANPKGMALFAMAYLNEFKRSASEKARERAAHCLDWLLENGVRGAHGTGWGYCFDWQSTLFFAPKGSPNAIVTFFCGEAFIKGFEILGEERYLQAAGSAARFLLRDLPVLHETGSELCIAYAPQPVGAIVLNINASAGALVAKAGSLLADPALLRDARRLISFVVERRTDYHAWYYTFPPGRSPITHDNYHTGGILDALHDYETYTGDGIFGEIHEKGLEYYARELFTPDGAPKYMNDAKYPHDIHGAAQGVISFSKAARLDPRYLELADRIARWTLANMFDENGGYFYYQKGRLFTKRYTLMRWCNAWMAKALSDLLLARSAQGALRPQPGVKRSRGPVGQDGDGR
jgi:hypothetical protein